MRIALLDADPRICGPMVWQRHLAKGFQALGHETQVVSSTTSGRPRSSWGVPKWGGRWSAFAPDQCVKNDDLPDLLDEYDFVVVPEPKVPALDKDAVKDGTATPAYVNALVTTKTPWSTALHGNNYAQKDAPFFRQLIESPSFTGLLVSHSQRSTESLDFDPSLYVSRIEHSTLPYAPFNDLDAPLPELGVVGSTGRFMFNKGYHVVAQAARFLEPDTTVELWGSATTGLGTNVTYSVYEGLLPYASKYVRHGDQEEKAGQPGVTEHGNTIRPFTWDVRLESGQLVRYLGNYVDSVATAARLGIHVNLTGYRYSGGLVEYSTLEAMDAGCMCITPGHVSDERFRTMVLDWTDPPGSMKSLDKEPELVTRVADAIKYLGHTANTMPDWREQVAFHNRQALREVSDPARVAALFLSSAG